MPRATAVPVQVPHAIRSQLKKLATSRTAPYEQVLRANIVRMAAAGWPNARIARRLGITEKKVRRWRGRFAARPALKSLSDAPRSGRPPRVGLSVRAKLISLACSRPEADKTPFRVVWSLAALQARLLAETGEKLSISEIGRILRQRDIRPHRIRMWLHSQDPQFNDKVERVCELYVSPPDDATVLCIDEKRLFAHQRRPGLKPAQPGRPCRKQFDYSRHGSSTLLAAFDVRTGEIYAECRAQRTGRDLVEFLEAIAARIPGKIVVIWDNLNVHHDGKEKRWTQFNARHGGRFSFVYTPKHASWVNQVELWFSILERRVLRHDSFPNVEAVEARVMGFVEHWNVDEAHPFRWTFRGTTRHRPLCPLVTRHGFVPTRGVRGRRAA